MGQTVEKPWGCLEKLHPGEESEAMGFSKANPRAQPKGLPSENPEAFRLSRGEVLQTIPRLFNSLSDFGFLEVQGQTCLNALYGKTSRKL